MHTGGGPDGTDVGATVGVATALDDLKSNGSALLIVGSVPDEVYARLSGCMLGDEDAADRRRVVVERGTSPDARFEDVERWTPEWTRILRWDVAARRSTTANGQRATHPGARAGPSPNSRDEPTPMGHLPDVDSTPRIYVGERGYAGASVTAEGSIAELGVAIGEAIEQLDSVAGGLDPAELRVAFDCVAPLLSEYDEQTVFRFLHVLTNDVRTVDGMAHVRLPEPLESETTRLLAPLFDAVVELRLDGTTPQQRWHFRDANVSSEWLPLGPQS